MPPSIPSQQSLHPQNSTPRWPILHVFVLSQWRHHRCLTVDYVVGQWLELAPEAEHTIVVVVDMWVVKEEERSGVVGEAD